jgi:hypothetical protein
LQVLGVFGHWLAHCAHAVVHSRQAQHEDAQNHSLVPHVSFVG